MRITMLGTGAPLAAPRATTGILVEGAHGPPLLVDTCGGFELATRLAASGIAIASLRAVILTHRHLDHTGGMQALYLARMPLDVYASADTHAGVAAVTAGCFPEWEPHPEIARHEVADGSRLTIAGLDVTFFAVEHRVPTLAVRISDGRRVFAFSADSRPCAALLACARDADLFLCDAIWAERDAPNAAARARELMHPTAREAGEMARQAGARRLVATHIGRLGTVANIGAEAEQAFGAPVTVAADGDRYEI